jgi:hypothetical protein
VYRSFSSVDDFMAELRRVKTAHQTRARLNKKIVASAVRNGAARFEPFLSDRNADHSQPVGADLLAKV